MEEQKRRYLTIKLSTEKFKLNPEFLSSMQKAEIDEGVVKLNELQRRILASEEAKQVRVTRAQLTEAYKSCVEKFETEDEFYQSLKKQTLTVEGFKSALKDELHCDLVMELVSKDFPPLERKQAEEYYQKHQIEFSRGKTWNLSQILITINDEFEENTRENALARIKEVREKTESEPFSELALQYSECPSAVEKGYLGWCEEGKLYSEITSALYTLPKEEVSEPIETEVGFHLIVCHDEKPPYVATFEEVWPYLQEKHASRAKAYLQRQWISQLGR